MKKIMKMFLAFVLMLSCIAYNGKIKAASSIEVSESDTSITIGNEYLSRTFNLEDNQLLTSSIENKRANTTYIPNNGSKEFYVNLTNSASDTSSLAALSKSGWSATTNSYHSDNYSGDGPAGALIDGSTSTIWHSGYDSSSVSLKPSTDPYYYVIFNLNSNVSFNCFSWTKRSNGTNGDVSQYQLYASNSSQTISADDSSWTLISEGSLDYVVNNTAFVNFDSTQSARQLKFVVISGAGGFASGAEFSLHSEKYSGGGNGFGSDQLTLSKYSVEETTNTINNVNKTGKMITFEFEPYTIQGATFTINEVIVMYEGDHFMRKFLEIEIDDEHKTTTGIDYIDLESLVLNSSDTTWSIPSAGGVVAMDEFKANLGQPIYIEGMFLGCEFPETYTDIVNNVGFMRYYSGKTFERLGLDNQLTTDGKYITWQTVCGAARSEEQAVIQADFFEYIYSIATPSEFRIQYNSWFDNMMLISDENILSSFIEVDREFSKTEVRPLDSYVVDDGWNNYNYTSVVDSSRSGTTLNTTGFWELNSKFPDGLTPSSELVEKFGSNFGVWVGPRGGYNFESYLAQIVTASQKGSAAGGSVDVADRVYIEEFKNMAINWQNNYGVNYWKWDGFANANQYNSFSATNGVASRANNHMIGGYNHMYHVTDLWEAWIDLMEACREAADLKGINDLWISLTCYVNPSPWFLQWANSVWLQCVYDQTDAGASSSKMDRQLTYRDGMYYDFIKNHQFQFPLKNVYNHDPIYGVEGTDMNASTATDEQFQNYLYMQATRGTAFWELYFSDSIMNDQKYEITSEYLKWAEANYDMLENAKMFGGAPNNNLTLSGGSSNANSGNPYGFACFDGSDGIISFRNPLTNSADISLTFDRNIGVSENTDCVYYIEHKHNYSGSISQTGSLTYGQTYTFNLAADECVIIRVSETQDNKTATIQRAYSLDNNTVVVRFDEKVSGNNITIDGVTINSVTQHADDVTYTLTTSTLPAGELTVRANVNDMANNESVSTKTFTHYNNQNVVTTDTLNVNGSQVIATSENALNSEFGFSVSSIITTTSTGAIVSQGSAYTLGIDENGYAYFEVNGVKALSDVIVNNNNEHTLVGVLENNGMVKIYVDGSISGANYDSNNQYYEVSQADIVVGNDGFVGNVKVSVESNAKGYDDLALDQSTTNTIKLDLTSSVGYAYDATAANIEFTTNKGNDGPVEYMLDENSDTLFHSANTSGNDYAKVSSSNMPAYIVINFDETKTFDAFSILNRNNANKDDITRFELYINNTNTLIDTTDFSNTNWVSIATNASEEALSRVEENYFSLEQDYTTSQIMLKVLSTSTFDDNSSATQSWITCKDFSLYNTIDSSTDDGNNTLISGVESYFYDGTSGNNGESTSPSNINDGNDDTYWHSMYDTTTLSNLNQSLESALVNKNNYSVELTKPYYLLVNLESKQTFNQFSWLNRDATAYSGDLNGVVRGINLYVNNTSNNLSITQTSGKAIDLSDWTLATSAMLEKGANSINLEQDFTTQQVLIEITHVLPNYQKKLVAVCKEFSLNYDSTLNIDTTISNVALNKTVTTGWSDNDTTSSANNAGMPPANAVNGTIPTDSNYDYGDFGKDGVDKSSWLQVDLGNVYDITSMKLWRYFNDNRTYDGTVIVVSKDETFDTSDSVVYNSDASNTHGFGEGSEVTYEEQSTGKDITFDLVEGRYVRIYMAGSNKGTTNHIVELEVNGYLHQEKQEIVTPDILYEINEVNNTTNMILEGYYEINNGTYTKVDTVSENTYAMYVTNKVSTPLAQAKLNSDGTYSVRFVSSVATLNPDLAGFELRVNDGNVFDSSTTTVYNTICETVDGDSIYSGAQTIFNNIASQYFVTVKVVNIPANALSSTINVKPYWKIYGSQDKQYGIEKTYVIQDLVDAYNEAN